jgi:transcriptional regulator with XRE-family HTH domain
LYIKKYRILRGYTQEQLADMVGISQAMIALLEAPNVTRRKSPRLKLLIKLAEALEICYNDILHFHCNECPMLSGCNKKQYLEYDDDFFDNNLIYYL